MMYSVTLCPSIPRWGLGVVLYQILCGIDCHPFLSKAQLAVQDSYQHQNRNIVHYITTRAPGVTWPEGIRQRYPADLVGLVEILLRKDESGANLGAVSQDLWVLLIGGHEYLMSSSLRKSAGLRGAVGPLDCDNE